MFTCAMIKKRILSYQVSDTRTVNMGNESVACVVGEGQIRLELSSGKFVELYGVYHVPNIRKNLITMSLPDCHGYNVNFGSI